MWGKQGFEKHKWVSLRPDTFVPDLLRQSYHPVPCNNAKEPHWHNQQYCMCHTLRYTQVEVIFRKHCLSKTTGSKISRGREDGTVSWMMLRWWHKDTHTCSLFMAPNSKNNSNNINNEFRTLWNLSALVQDNDAIIFSPSVLFSPITTSYFHYIWDIWGRFYFYFSSIQWRVTRDACVLDSHPWWSKCMACVVCTTRVDLESIVKWQWMLNNVFCVEKEEGYSTVGCLWHWEAVCLYGDPLFLFYKEISRYSSYSTVQWV